eukprot:TRINITY_DN28358_c0_g1_i2.p1 TRINITY_DN28358_c0_g1~~TRINITY_DN28358_c0_g1_i2.p1  ORF type:complete len:691 (-),score=99.88 TRINITY_DN28358_c0_g1_i2:39-1913(-)
MAPAPKGGPVVEEQQGLPGYYYAVHGRTCTPTLGEEIAANSDITGLRPRAGGKAPYPVRPTSALSAMRMEARERLGETIQESAGKAGFQQASTSPNGCPQGAMSPLGPSNRRIGPCSEQSPASLVKLAQEPAVVGEQELPGSVGIDLDATVPTNGCSLKGRICGVRIADSSSCFNEARGNKGALLTVGPGALPHSRRSASRTTPVQALPSEVANAAQQTLLYSRSQKPAYLTAEVRRRNELSSQKAAGEARREAAIGLLTGIIKRTVLSQVSPVSGTVSMELVGDPGSNGRVNCVTQKRESSGGASPTDSCRRSSTKQASNDIDVVADAGAAVSTSLSMPQRQCKTISPTVVRALTARPALSTKMTQQKQSLVRPPQLGLSVAKRSVFAKANSVKCRGAFSFDAKKNTARVTIFRDQKTSKYKYTDGDGTSDDETCPAGFSLSSTSPQMSPRRKEDEDHKNPISVTVVSAENLISLDPGGTSDPFCSVQVDNRPKQKFSTHVVRSTLTPTWNAAFTISDYKRDEPLRFTVFDKDVDGDQFLGRVILPPEKMTVDGFQGTLPLAMQDGSSAGVIRVKVEFLDPLREKFGISTSVASMMSVAFRRPAKVTQMNDDNVDLRGVLSTL